MILAMLKTLLKPLAFLGLPAIHHLGKVLGSIMFLLMPASRKLVRSNLIQSKLYADDKQIDKVVKLNFIESGKALLESLALWGKPDTELLSWVRSCQNWQIVEDAISNKKGIIFLTPHLGCFEITSIFYGAKYPITILYRPPKKEWMTLFINAGRKRNNVRLAPANLHGVRMLLQALKRGEAVGILPDQIPASGEGEWAPFFGKPAYTMTLASKLANKTDAVVIMAFGERRADSSGFDIHLKALGQNAISSPELLNQAIEQQITQNPVQYLWRYPRYKRRRHAMKKVEPENAAPDASG